MQTEIQEIPLKFKKILFHCEYGLILEYVAHKGCEVSPGDIRNPTGRDPKQPAAVADLLRCLLPQPFCVSL